MFDFEAIYEAVSVNHAVKLLKEHPNAIIVAGGSDILIKIREGRLPSCELISIQSLNELRGITIREDDTLCIGSLDSFSHIADNPLIKQYISVLGDAALTVGGPQIRNIGTIGGNICNGATSADTASTLLAWDALLELICSEGVRYVPVSEFYIHAGKTDIKTGEILTSILIHKKSYEHYKGFYYKYSVRNAMDISVCNCSVNVRLSSDKKTVEDVRAAYGAAGPVPLRAYKAENAVKGKKVTSELIDEFAEAAVENLNPRSSYRANKEFRLHILKELSKKCLTESICRCGGIIDGAV